ncbi:MAG TPA: BON domain-containing protein [Thermoanaerobaculia bacterium]|nr:BON domain-containing protein [Thermoanaerobaculia bacterium]
MRTTKTKALSWGVGVSLALSGLLAVACQRTGDEAVEVTRDAEGAPQVEIHGDKVEKNLDKAGQDVQAAADQAGKAIEQGAQRVESRVGPVVRGVLDDAAVTTRVKARLVADPDVNAFHVDVDTVDGRVTLNGKVASEHQRQEAEELASRTQGVVSVVNLIQVAGKEALPPPPPAPGK